MDQTEEREIEISNEYDYSNIVAEVEIVSFLVQYCNSYYNQFIKLCADDEEKNAKLKSEYKFFQYKKSYSSKFEVAIKQKGNSFSNIACKNYESFIESVNAGHLKNIDSLIITLDLSFKRGKDFETKEHENSFKITFKPYEITFKRKSNYDDSTMNQIENTINEILKKFRTQNTIFCSK